MRDYLPILCMIVLVVLFVLLSFVASTFLAPKRPTSAKEAPYECGIVPEYEPAERFPVKFYLVAMAFIVLDVEIIFLYPFTTIFRGLGAYGLITMGIFLLVAAGAVRLPPLHRRARLGPGQAGRDPRRRHRAARGRRTGPRRPRPRGRRHRAESTTGKAAVDGTRIGQPQLPHRTASRTS